MSQAAERAVSSMTIGILDKFSCVKTLAKKLLSSSAFSLSVSVEVPSVFNKFPIDDFGLVFYFTYFQNLLAFFFAFKAMLFSLSILAFFYSLIFKKVSISLGC